MSIFKKYNVPSDEDKNNYDTIFNMLSVLQNEVPSVDELGVIMDDMLYNAGKEVYCARKEKEVLDVIKSYIPEYNEFVNKIKTSLLGIIAEDNKRVTVYEGKNCVTLEQAKELAELSYEDECFYYYSADGSINVNKKRNGKDIFSNSWNSAAKATNLFDIKDIYDAPVLADAVNWIYDKFGVFISVGQTGQDIFVVTISDKTGTVDTLSYFKEPISATSAGLSYAIEHIKNHKIERADKIDVK